MIGPIGMKDMNYREKNDLESKNNFSKHDRKVQKAYEQYFVSKKIN